MKITSSIRAVYLFFKLAIIAGIFLAMIVVLPFNPAVSRNTALSKLRPLIPEGWAFFTRNPREPEMEIFYKINGKWISNPLAPMGSFFNALGIFRRTRAQSVDLATVMSQVKREDWSKLPAAFISNKNASDTATVHEVYYPYSNPVLGDTMAVVRRDPIPWSYSKLLNEDKVECEFVILKIHEVRKTR